MCATGARPEAALSSEERNSARLCKSAVTRPVTRHPDRRRVSVALLSVSVAIFSRRAGATDLRPPRAATEPSTIGAAPSVKAPTPPPPPPPPPMAPAYGLLPKPNTRSHKYPDKFLRPYRGKTIGEFWDEFSVRLRAAGYDRGLKIFSRPDGLVAILPFELDDEDGVPLTPPDLRFSLGRAFILSWKAFFRRLFGDSTGTGRWITFVLAPPGKKTGPFPPAPWTQQQEFDGTGLGSVPSDLRSMKITNADTLCAYVYAYELPKQGDPVFLNRGPFDAIDYLRSTGLPTE